MNPRLLRYPSLSRTSEVYGTTRDCIYDYEYSVENALKRLQRDLKIRPEDRKLILAFHRHIKAKKVSLGRQAKYLNHLIRCAQLIPTPFRRAKRVQVEELMNRQTIE